ncbi:MAG: hypothetical protein Q8M40_06140 [Legionella sp.]|nr:hypothetical protein [Legionella sp.]
MPLQEKILYTEKVHNSLKRSRTEKHYYNDCGEAIIMDDTTIPQGQTFHNGPILSDMDSIYKKLLECIDNNNSATFQKLLNTEFIEKIQRTKSSKFNSHNSLTGGAWGENVYSNCLVRPNIEALILAKPQYLIAVLNKLIEKNSEEFYSIFLDSINNTDFKDKNLGSWTAEIKAALINNIDKLEQFGKGLKVQGTQKNSRPALEKGNALVDFAEEMKKATKKDVKEDNSSDLKEKCENILHKAKLIQTADDKKPEFSVHREYKRFLVNLATILFSAGLINLGKYLITGNGFFANKTNTENKVDALEKEVGLRY